MAAETFPDLDEFSRLCRNLTHLVLYAGAIFPSGPAMNLNSFESTLERVG